ncbi:hypothetical protein P691DRAFT_782509 [Macrolepiota fuliginosa MF-IS2]|uniref:Uncharacterized protein n=1 Tax=Macrolepiota fuliginosa MF-IS2 TaxID=1400762 RepID=A0A9P5WWM7_9AGAR|nr:hypothetical protein P691DRAFT_782509 [Macrolepiota fuliginosa MF-IS2]
MYSDVPLIWVIASRPEPYITATFSQPIIASCSIQQEIMIDSDETCADIERYLRDELKKIRTKYPALRIVAEWPKEHDFLKLSAASDGLFAFASTAVRFIDDPAYGNPIVRLKQHLNVINDIPPIPSLEGHAHPMATLDALYSRILSQVPNDCLHETRRLLLLVLSGYSALPFICNWLGMTLDDIYGVLHHLHSILNIPSPETAHSGSLTPLHKLFRDYLQDFGRLGVFTDFECQGTELHIECMQRIFNEVSDKHEHNLSAPTSCISPSWDYHMSQGYDDRQNWIQRQQDDLYACAMFTFWAHFTKGEAVPIHYWKLFDMRFRCEYGWDNMWDVVQTVFGKKCRFELLQHGVLREIPIGTLDTSLSVEGTRYSEVWYRYKRLAVEDPPSDCTPADNSPLQDRWRPDDRHNEHQIWEGEPKVEFTQYVLQQGQMRSPDHPVIAYIDITNFGWILYEYTDPADERAQWEFIIPYQFPSQFPEETGI